MSSHKFRLVHLKQARDAQKSSSKMGFGQQRKPMPDLIALKREMEFLERKLEFYRYSIYTGQPIEGYAEWSEIPERCPVPAWTSKQIL